MVLHPASMTPEPMKRPSLWVVGVAHVVFVVLEVAYLSWGVFGEVGASELAGSLLHDGFYIAFVELFRPAGAPQVQAPYVAVELCAA